MKINKLFVLPIAIILLIIFLNYFPIGFFYRTFGDSAEIYINENLQLRQGINQCAPYSTMAVISALEDKTINPNVIDENMKWRFKNNMTLPFGITKYLNDENIKTSHKFLLLFSNTQRLIYLKRNLDKNEPIIILNKSQGILHYFTLLGYENSNFYLYDSLQKLNSDESRITIDENGKLPGNKTLTEDELLHLWRDAKIKVSLWYLIVSSKKINSNSKN